MKNPAGTPLSPALTTLSLGSNLGNRELMLWQACTRIAVHPEIRVIALSSIYESEPEGVPPEFASLNFLNMVMLVETKLLPLRLLQMTQRIEQAAGRNKRCNRFYPRPVDIDIITYGNQNLDTKVLTLPHPRAHLRRFVLQPLAELMPRYQLPGQCQSVSDTLSQLPPFPWVRLMEK